jgi:DNA polymerase-3 subunit delta'
MQIAAEELGPVIGHAAAKAEWRAAVSGGRLHHGWMLRGPRGAGKSRLALQFAAQLLGSPAGADLAATEDDPIGHLLVTGAHPDIRIIRRPVDDKGKQKTEIPVDSVRDLAQFFSLRPAMGGYRIAIVDAVDELNRFGANALLKTLEEPPPKSVLILIAHGEQALPPTVRSRCRVLNCPPLSDEETVSALIASGLPPERAASVARLAPGQPGRALVLDTPEASAAAEAMRNTLRTLGQSDGASFQRVMMAGSKSDTAMAAAIDTLLSSVRRRAEREADPVLAGDWAAVVLDVMRLDAEARALNQDRGQTLAAALTRVSRLAGA